MKLKRLLILWMLLSMAAAPRLKAETKEEFEERLRMEVTMVLDKFLGVGKSQVVVLVDADPRLMVPPLKKVGEPPSRRDGPKDKADDSQLLWSDYSNRTRKSLMPGFAARQQMVVRQDDKGQEDARDKKKEEIPPGVEPLVLWKVKRILVSVVLDRSVDEQSAQKVGAMVMDMLGLDPDRGDKLNVYKLPFKSPWQLLMTSPSTWMQLVRWAVILFMIGLAGWGLYRIWPRLIGFFRKKPPIEVDINQGSDGEEGEPKEGEEPAAEEALPEGLAALAEAAQAPTNGNGNGHAPANGNGNGKRSLMERLKAFTFVSRANAQLLGEMISKDEDIQLAVLASFLDPALGSTVLHQLGEEKRRRVLLIMSNASHVPPETLKKLEAEIELRLQYAVGGTEAVSDLVSQMDPREQNAVLQALWQKDPQLAQKVHQMIFRFEDIFHLPERELRFVVGAAPIADWVAALNGAHPSYANALAQVLPEETREVFRQHMEMGGGSGKGASEAQWRILKAAKDLKAQGRIQLRKPAVSPQGGQ